MICWTWRQNVARGRRPRETFWLKVQHIICCPNPQSIIVLLYLQWVRIIRIYHDFVQGQGNPPECQRFVVHDEACRVVDVANLWHEGGFPCPCTKSWLIIFLLPLSILITKLHFLLSKTTSKRFLLRKWRQLRLIMTSRHCLMYDVRRCSLKRSCLYRGR